MEIKYISENSNSLNVSPGGGGMTINSGWKHSSETIEKLKEKTPPMLGKKHSPETIEKIRQAALKGHFKNWTTCLIFVVGSKEDLIHFSKCPFMHHKSTSL